MTTTPSKPIDFAEAMKRLRERLGIPSLPMPPEGAPTPPRPPTETDDDKGEGDAP
jgi:hypothetical protein